MFNLAEILKQARAAGLVVDLSFGYEVVAGRTVEDHRKGIQALAGAMSADPANYNHVMFDVQNEHSLAAGHPCFPSGISQTELTNLMIAGKTGDPDRVVTASVAGSDPGPHYTAMINMLTAGGTALAVHETRHYVGKKWYFPSAVVDLVSGQLQFGIRYPIYMQEPDRWMRQSDTNLCPTVDFVGVDNPCELTSNELLLNAREALRQGAAAWTFHTEFLFFPHRPGRRVWGTPEANTVLGLIGALTGHCWGGTAPPGWFSVITCS